MQEIHIGRVIEVDDAKRFATVEDVITRTLGVYDVSRIKKEYARSPWGNSDAEIYKSAIMRREQVGFTIDDGGKVLELARYTKEIDRGHCSYHEITRHEGRFLAEHHERLRRVS